MAWHHTGSFREQPTHSDAVKPSMCRRCGTEGAIHATAEECITHLRDVIGELSERPLRAIKRASKFQENP